jgi:hypothetical protein
MTVQSKHFIELSDIVGIRCECRNPECRATLLLPLNGEMGDALLYCPKCKRGWTRLNGSYELEVKRHLVELERLKDMVNHLGFTLTLEVNEEAIPTS